MLIYEKDRERGREREREMIYGLWIILKTKILLFISKRFVPNFFLISWVSSLFVYSLNSYRWKMQKSRV